MNVVNVRLPSDKWKSFSLLSFSNSEQTDDRLLKIFHSSNSNMHRIKGDISSLGIEYTVYEDATSYEYKEIMY